MFKGSMVALVTPFKDNQVDFSCLEKLIEMHAEAGTDGLVPVGTTGESPTLSNEEHKKVIEFVVKKSAGRMPVIAGAGANSTQEAVELTEFAEGVGADATLQVCPYYNKPTQEGLYRHFEAIAEGVDLPVVLYNIPGRTGGSGLSAETVAKLSELKNVAAIKEATGSMDQASKIKSLCDITILSGDDSLTLPLCAVGGEGVISVAANIVPKDVKRFMDYVLEGDFINARKWHFKLFELSKSMLGLSTNPIPVKAAMAMLGMIEDEIRLPMTHLDQESCAKLKQALSDYGLL
ncbi:4-hydroxy-tetrahydrodipicolinate synthase [Sedimentisphaera cyanobacteriorum]|uniref:4-hydroxy-tetrahydrodipicolinate synthase n=1 Tax=Sedimentisphaera cyanobacteriorum TaxID=1940790 RepID=A0A1Q2HMG0_9BACT|nr:4-hydroxy-tetrahydrodipicolinate synthase [Sedimentisphaera cyanobacteriorum]AQQ08709.1 4-hydroxy-tetrahydrodipicolinate synthase [Sedimentisphaera cyanobacteriorum]